MSAADFFDTNVLLYLISSDQAKADRIEDLLQDRGTISIQVLDEFTSVAVRKYGMKIRAVRDVLSVIRFVCTAVVEDIETHEAALVIAERFKFSIYDSALLAAALRAGCTTFYSEDLQHNQKIDNLTVRNPFV